MKFTRDGAIWLVMFIGGALGFATSHFDALAQALHLSPEWRGTIELASAFSAWVGGYLRMSPAALSQDHPMATNDASQTLTVVGHQKSDDKP